MGREKKYVNIDRAVEMYQSGLFPAEIGKKYNVSDATIVRRLKERGVYEGFEHRSLYCELREHHIEMIDGLLLGDGTIGLQLLDTSAWLSLTQCKRVKGTDGRPWVREVHRALSESGLQCSPQQEDANQNGQPILVAQTLSYKNLVSQRYRWYKEWTKPGKFLGGEYKVVPKDLTISPLSIAWWFCGDGSAERNGGFDFATQGFAEEDINFLVDCLKRLGCTPHIRRVKLSPDRLARSKPWTSYLGISLGVRDAYDVGKYILPHVPECFHYKLTKVHKYTGSGTGRVQYGCVPKQHLLQPPKSPKS